MKSMQQWIDDVIRNCRVEHSWILCGKHCGWTSLQYASVDIILCRRPVDGWHVRCWCELREVENAGKASPYLEIY